MYENTNVSEVPAASIFKTDNATFLNYIVVMCVVIW